MSSACAIVRTAGLFALLVSSCTAGVAANRQDPPPPDEIVRRIVARQKAKQGSENQSAEDYSFIQRTVREKLDAGGSGSDREEALYQVSPMNGIAVPKLLLKNGKPPSPSDLKQEEERFKKERRKAEQRKLARNDENDVEFNEELAAKYQYELLGEEAIDGRPVYVIAFKPRRNDLPIRRRADYVLNRVAGKAWIDREDYEIAKVEMRLTEKTSFWLGIFGTLRDFNLQFEQGKLAEGAWLPKHFVMRIDARILLTSLRERQEAWWSDFHRVTPHEAARIERRSE